MSKITATKFDRLYVEGVGKARGTFLKRFDPKPVGNLTPLPCHANCGRPIMVAEGQVAKFHKECRKNKNGYQPIIRRS